MKKNRLVIDITQLVHWPGRLTGIPRVMNELSLRYANDQENVFVVWSDESSCFYELDIQSSLEKRGQGIFYRPTSRSKRADNMAQTKESSKKALKKAVKELGRYNPELYERIVSKLRLQLYDGKAGPTIELEAGDTLFILWGEWGQQKYIDTLKAIHDKGVPLIQIVYDMLPIATPQYSGHSTSSMQEYFTSIIPLCNLVLSISEYTKKDLTNWLETQGLHVPDIRAFRLGDDFKLSKPVKPGGDFARRVRTRENFILCVGTIEARKNHTLLYYAYKLAAERGIDLPKLIIVGRHGWKTDDIYDIITTDPQIKETFVFMSDISDEELSWLYQNCQFSVYPSFYEGWGLPIAESIAYGTPCISSNTSSMPEIAGNLIRYFSPSSSEECLQEICRHLQSEEYAEAKKRIAKYRPTSWDDTFRQVDNFIKGS